MTVTFWKLGPDGRNVSAGTITYDGRRFVLGPPESDLLRGVMAKPVTVPRVGTVDAFGNPTAWMHGLQYRYKSAYLRASAPSA